MANKIVGYNPMMLDTVGATSLQSAPYSIAWAEWVAPNAVPGDTVQLDDPVTGGILLYFMVGSTPGGNQWPRRFECPNGFQMSKNDGVGALLLLYI